MRRVVILATVLNGLSALAPQLIALVSLRSDAFGEFSAAYLAFALSSSMILSLLCDAWVIIYPTRGDSDWSRYSKLLVTLSVVLALVSGAITLAFLTPEFAGLTTIAMAFAVYRLGARYFLAYEHRWGAAILADTITLVVTVVAYFVVAAPAAGQVWGTMVSWCLGSFAGSVVTGLPHVGVRVSGSWLHRNRKTVSPLVLDSLIMNIAAIGTPYVLLPQLGVAGFGLYRSISNLGAPIRLLLTPLRPLVLASPPRAVALRMTVLVVSVSLASGAAISGAIVFLAKSGVALGVLSELGGFWLPAGLYGCATLLLLYYSLVCRALGQPSMLIAGRVVNTAVGFIGPLLGFWFFGVTGAIWAFSVASLLCALVWMWLAHWGRFRTSEAP